MNGLFSDNPAWERVLAAHMKPETEAVETLLQTIPLDRGQRDAISKRAAEFIDRIRAGQRGFAGIEDFLHAYDLSSEEGIALMNLAEAMLRIPDSATRDVLIRDHIGAADWDTEDDEESWLLEAASHALSLTARILQGGGQNRDPVSLLRALVGRLGAPVVRTAVLTIVREFGDQFIFAETIEEAEKKAPAIREKGYLFSYDMLGERAKTAADAERYFTRYLDAIRLLARTAGGTGIARRPGISVKLSALHPRFEMGQRERLSGELAPRFIELCKAAADNDLGLCIDSEEAETMEITLDTLAAASADKSLKGWDGLGLAVQAYQKRSLALIDWLAALAEAHDRRLMIRLVKGAYWDGEIKRAQKEGLEDYPVFTRKRHSDASFLAGASRLLDNGERFFPCFATHNAHSVAAILSMAGSRSDYEFQRLHGMGDDLYDALLGDGTLTAPCRIYAPVGAQKELLPYLVRRMLENGANASFVHRILDRHLPAAALAADPLAEIEKEGAAPHPDLIHPRDLYQPARINSRGPDLSDGAVVHALEQAVAQVPQSAAQAMPVIGGKPVKQIEMKPVFEPADRSRQLGEVGEAGAAVAEQALDTAAAAYPIWQTVPVARRAEILRQAAELYEKHDNDLLALIVREGGRTIPDAISELREAVDFLRFYGAEAERLIGEPSRRPGITGERNELQLGGRGPFLCISPWNFPLAIFTGQMAAAMAAGNPVLAKPAEQTPLTAMLAIGLLHEAGVPSEVLHFLPGPGAEIAKPLLGDSRLAGVAFTGSVETAQHINKSLAERDGPIATLIAETGGQNAMIADSSALPEHVTRDVVISAFQSAGQRCSALRLLFVQNDIADEQIAMIAGAVEELRLGDPGRLATDVGPIIDEPARQRLSDHLDYLRDKARPIAEAPVPGGFENGVFFAPRAFEIDDPAILKGEVFGPILHIVRYDAGELDRVIDAINNTGYGLTLSVHSRCHSRIDKIAQKARVGNIYINRDQIGAVVSSQPFGGQGLSGTGPKAGGPNYLLRFTSEKTVTANLTAMGGDVDLLSLEP